jgi:hypothetical protein
MALDERRAREKEQRAQKRRARAHAINLFALPILFTVPIEHFFNSIGLSKTPDDQFKRHNDAE